MLKSLDMKILNLTPNPENPRTITDQKLKQLKKTMKAFGSLDGFIYNRKTKQLAGGHQRQKMFGEALITITKKYSKPTKTGTVAEGYAELDGNRFPYREVYWDEKREKAANIAANKGAGEWDMPKLGEWMASLSKAKFDLDMTMFDIDELKQFEGLEVTKELEQTSTVSEHERKGPTGIDEDDIPETAKARTKLGEIYLAGSNKIMVGDCLNKLKLLKDNSIDSVVTDPPYGLSFMGKSWDYEVPSVDIWKEALRVLKPGGHLLSFGGTRTYHRMVVNIEDAGFEIRDQVMWLYGSGFPKSQDVSKQIDKQAGASREVVGSHTKAGDIKSGRMHASSNEVGVITEILHTAPATPEAKQWEGWGTALKPANEPICLARKPLEKGLTVAANVLKYGTGAMNIDASRIGYTSEADAKAGRSERKTASKGFQSFTEGEHDQLDRSDRSGITGRWPANLILDEEAAAALDEQSGHLHGSGNKADTANGKDKSYEFSSYEISYAGRANRDYGAKGGGASRFFYVAKASKRERNAGLEGMEKRQGGGMSGTADKSLKTGSGNERDGMNQNFHPTVKPVSLMEYLINLVTPPKGTVLEPFGGSGSTLIAAEKSNNKCVVVELDPQYCDIILKRWEKYSGKKAVLQKVQTKKLPK